MSDRAKNLGDYAKTGGPGRPKGSLSGRGKLALELDKLFGKPKNRRLIREALQRMLEEDPVKFYKQIAEIYMPKEGIPLNVNFGEPVTFRAWLKRQMEIEQENE